MAYIYDLTDTWNAAGTVFNAIKMNVTNTASAAGSKIVSLQVGATDRFTVDKDGNGYFSGNVQSGGSLSASNFHTSGNSGTIGMQDNTASIMAYNATGSGGITNTLRFITGAAERMRITSAGFVSINTSAPSDRLDVNGRVRSRGSLGINASPPSDFWGTDGSANASLFTGHGNVGSQGAFGFDLTANGYRNSSGTWTTLNTNGSTSAAQIRLGTGDGSIIFGSDATKATGSSFAVTERMRITSAGNVGINETAPDYKLDVNGTFGFTPGSSVTPVDNGDVVFELTDNTTLTIKAKGSDGVVRSGTITLA